MFEGKYSKYANSGLFASRPPTMMEPSGASKAAETRKTFKQILLKQMNCVALVANKNIFQANRIPETLTLIKFSENGTRKEQSVKIEVRQPGQNLLRIAPPKAVESQNTPPTIIKEEVEEENPVSSTRIPDSPNTPTEHSPNSSGRLCGDETRDEMMAIETLSQFMRNNVSNNSSGSSQLSQNSDEFLTAGQICKTKEYMRKRKIYKYDSEKERKDNKRDQNREAAKRYREKLKSTTDVYVEQIQELERINIKKQLELKALETEKRVMIEHLKNPQKSPLLS